jgi:small-conductance mechanosensitive channel
MWGWIVANSHWILIASGSLVVLLLFFSDQVQKLIGRIEPKEWKVRPFSGTIAGFWYLEAFALVLAALSVVALLSSDTGLGKYFTVDAFKGWFNDYGFSNVITIVVGVVVWVVFKQAVPPLVNRVITVPRRGESREGLKRRADTIRGVFLGMARIIIVLVVVLMIISQYQPITPILAGLGAVLLGVGFGAQYLVRDIIAGFFILVENQYRVGDVARVADVSGLVEEITLRKTVLRDLDGIVHHIPNGEITVSSNFSRHFARVNLNISVAYGTDLDYAIDVINRVCKKMFEEEKWKSMMLSLPQVLRVDSLGDSGIDIKILGDVKPLQQWTIMGQLRLRIKNEFDRVGIEIPWPHTKLYFGNRPEDTMAEHPEPEKEKRRHRRIRTEPPSDQPPDEILPPGN